MFFNVGKLAVFLPIAFPHDYLGIYRYGQSEIFENGYIAKRDIALLHITKVR